MDERRSPTIPLDLPEDHIVKMVQVRPKRIPAVQRGNYAIMDLLAVLAFVFKRATESVPQDEERPIVLTETIVVAGMMDTMQRGRVEKQLHFRQRWNKLCMNPELPQKAQLSLHDN